MFTDLNYVENESSAQNIVEMWKFINIALAVFILSVVRSENDCAFEKAKLDVSWTTIDVVSDKHWSYVDLHEDTIIIEPIKFESSSVQSSSSRFYCVDINQDYVLTLDQESVDKIKICDTNVLNPGDIRALRVTAAGHCETTTS